LSKLSIACLSCNISFISIEDIPEKLSDNIIKKICELYEITEDALLEVLDGGKYQIYQWHCTLSNFQTFV
jgi:hypothetical protein